MAARALNRFLLILQLRLVMLVLGLRDPIIWVAIPTAADIVGPAAQGIPAAPNGDFADVIRAIRTRNAYANLHTTMFQGGEVRGTVEAPRGHGE